MKRKPLKNVNKIVATVVMFCGLVSGAWAAPSSSITIKVSPKPEVRISRGLDTTVCPGKPTDFAALARVLGINSSSTYRAVDFYNGGWRVVPTNKGGQTTGGSQAYGIIKPTPTTTAANITFFTGSTTTVDTVLLILGVKDTLASQNGCTAYDTLKIAVSARPNMDILANPLISGTLCASKAPITFDTTHISSNAVFSAWSIVNGRHGATATGTLTTARTSLTFTNPSTVNQKDTVLVVLAYTDNVASCGTYYDTLAVEVYPLPNLDFSTTTIANNAEICSGVKFALDTVNGGVNAQFVQWTLPTVTGVTATFKSGNFTTSPDSLKLVIPFNQAQTAQKIYLDFKGKGIDAGYASCTYRDSITVNINPPIDTALLFLVESNNSVNTDPTAGSPYCQEEVVALSGAQKNILHLKAHIVGGTPAATGYTVTYAVDGVAQSPVGPAQTDLPINIDISAMMGANHTFAITKVVDSKGCVLIP